MSVYDRRTFLKQSAALTVAAGVAGGRRPARAFGQGAAPPAHPFFKNKRGLEVIAHRGGKGQWPEETLYAFEQAIAIGADILEMDVRSTADGVLVLMHNEDVKDTTDGKGSTKTFWFRREAAPANASNVKLVRDLDAGFDWPEADARTHPFRGLGIKVPTLEEVFDTFRNTDARMIVEIKESDPATARSFCEMVGRFPALRDRVLVASFYDTVLDQVRADPRCAGMATSAATCESVKLAGQISTNKFLKLLSAAPCESIKKVVEHMAAPQAQGAGKSRVHAIQLPGEVVSKELVDRAHQPDFNLQVHAWTINDPAQMSKLRGDGVDGIITDYPGPLLELLGRTKRSAPGV